MGRSLVKRFRGLPKGSLVNKLLLILYRRIHNRLIRAKMLDINGKWYPASQPLGLEPLPAEQSDSNRDVICVTGFGYSGSGAVLDILSEYDDVTLVHAVDKDCGKQLDNTVFAEFDLLRHVGGVFDLEAAFQTENAFVRDGKIRAFLRFVAFLYDEEAPVWDDAFLLCTRQFLDSLIHYRCRTGNGGYVFSRHLALLGTRGAELLWGPEGKSDLFFLRDLTVSEYRALAKRYITGLFDGMGTTRHLLLDQAVSDYTAEMERYVDYLGPIKLIAVSRDPRDVYATARLKKEDWIPEDVDSFIANYGPLVNRYTRLHHPDYLLVRFEDVVLNYEVLLRRMEDFLGFRPENHRFVKKSFDPAISRKNIGVYRSFADQATMDKIHKALAPLCYEGDKGEGLL